jgi:DNA-binding NtrC family response regulator
MSPKTLITWIGDNDLNAIHSSNSNNQGAIADFLTVEGFSNIILLHTREAEAARYNLWLSDKFNISTTLVNVPLKTPHDFDLAYAKAKESILELNLSNNNVSYLLSSGTKAMSSALLFIGCYDLNGKIYYNWIDPNKPDLADRYVQIKWPEKFSMALFASQKQATGDTEPLIDFQGRELSNQPGMKSVYEQARRVAVTNTPVLIHGETGTGKEILANYVRKVSSRNRNDFVVVNCGSIPENLVDSELFGYKRGAFTGADKDTKGKFASANNGTIFLDEIGELPLQAQVRLLRFLQEGEITPVGSVSSVKVDVRVVAASHRNLREMVKCGEFRADLYFRLAKYPLTLPPLRFRGDDLQLIAKQILSTDKDARGIKTTIDNAAWATLESYNWPGNIRELQNIITRCAIDANEHDGHRLITAPLVERVLSEQGLDYNTETPQTIDIGKTLLERVHRSGDTLQTVLEQAEAQTIQEAISQTSTQKEAGKLLGYSAQNLSNTKKRLKEKGCW